MINKDLKRRILEISHKYHLSHLGSNLTAVDIIDEIYSIKEPGEKFVLSSGHAGLALYVVLEKYSDLEHDAMGLNQDPRLNAEEMWNHHGTHPDKCSKCHIDCSTGSLGQGLPIAVGMALAEKQNFESQIQDSCSTRECEHQRMKNVYCLISDGECAEGSIWEAIRIINDNQLTNLILYVNWNGYGAYDESSKWALSILSTNPLINFRSTTFDFDFLKGQEAHYHVMNQGEYEKTIKSL